MDNELSLPGAGIAGGTRHIRSVLLHGICLAAICSVNCLFAFKYFPRWIPHGLAVSLLYCVGFLAFQIFASRLQDGLFTRRRYWLMTGAMLVAWMIALQLVDASSLRVDRWQMVNLWFDNLFSGRNPYTPVSDTSSIPGPFPVLFLFSLPFYWIHETGYYSLAGFALLAFLLRDIFKDNCKTATLCLASFFLALPMQWEIIARSTLFVNAVMVLTVMRYFSKCSGSDVHQILTLGIVGGLALSTRSVAAIPLLISSLALMCGRRLSLIRGSMFAGTIIGTLLLTLVPFYLLHPAEFTRHNPLSVQSALLPAWWVGALFLVAAGMIGMLTRTLHTAIRWSGILLYLLVLCAFAVAIRNMGLPLALNGSGFDISYFVFGLPFLLISALTRARF